MENSNQTSQIRKEVSKTALAASKVYKADFQKAGTLTAELRQIITTTAYYPKMSVKTSLQDNVFSSSDFGIADEPFTNTENRVAFLPVPEGMTVEQVNTKLASYPEACIYVMKSNHPILSEEQNYAINNGITTKEIIANKQVVRYPKGHEKAGQIVLTQHGKAQYRVSAFSATAKEDIDTRNAVVSDQFVTEAIAAELQETSVPTGQSI